MPDISMCATEDCPLRFRCYRSPDSGTKPNQFRQSWMFFQWKDTDPPSCDDFSPIRSRTEAENG